MPDYKEQVEEILRKAKFGIDAPNDIKEELVAAPDWAKLLMLVTVIQAVGETLKIPNKYTMPALANLTAQLLIEHLPLPEFMPKEPKEPKETKPIKKRPRR